MKDFYHYYPAEFQDLLEHNYRTDNYIGQGNPNSKILIIGKECTEKDYAFCNNSDIWKSKAPNQIQNWFEARSWDSYHPRFPFYGQLMLKDNNTKKNPKSWEQLNRGTSVTWKAIQKFINYLLPPDKQVLPRQQLNFYDYCFLTELSCNCMPVSNKNDLTKASIKNRLSQGGVLSHPFFKKFPVIIFDIYHYFDWYRDINIIQQFGGEKQYNYKGIIVSEEAYNQYDEESKKRMPLYQDGVNWELVNGGFKKGEFINVHISKDSTQILLHTSHFVDVFQPRSDVWMEVLADTVKPFLGNI